MQGDFFFGVFFLWNTSTVPLQLRWFQAAAGISRGLLYQLNNMALLLSFIPCRILIIPFLMHMYGAMKGWPLTLVTPCRSDGICWDEQNDQRIRQANRASLGVQAENPRSQLSSIMRQK